MTENIKEGLELYKIFNDKIMEAKQIYAINNAFWLITGGLFVGLLTTELRELIFIKFVISIMGMFISCVWFTAVEGAQKWRNWWIWKLIFIEEWLQEQEKNDPNNIWNHIEKRGAEEKAKESSQYKKLCEYIKGTGKGFWQEVGKKDPVFGFLRYIKEAPRAFFAVWLLLFLWFLPSAILY